MIFLVTALRRTWDDDELEKLYNLISFWFVKMWRRAEQRKQRILWNNFLVKSIKCIFNDGREKSDSHRDDSIHVCNVTNTHCKGFKGVRRKDVIGDDDATWVHISHLPHHSEREALIIINLFASKIEEAFPGVALFTLFMNIKNIIWANVQMSECKIFHFMPPMHIAHVDIVIKKHKWTVANDLCLFTVHRSKNCLNIN